jgi:hypothetical protein
VAWTVLPLTVITSKTGFPLRTFSFTEMTVPCGEAFWMIAGIVSLVIDSSVWYCADRAICLRSPNTSFLGDQVAAVASPEGIVLGGSIKSFGRGVDRQHQLAVFHFIFRFGRQVAAVFGAHRGSMEK